MHIEALEDRTTPATLDSIGFGDVTFTAGVGISNNVTISTDGIDTTITDSIEIITLTPAAVLAGWTGSGTNTVTGPNVNIFTLTILTGDANDSVTVESVQHPLTVDTGSGTGNAVLLGGVIGLGAQGLQAPVLVQSSGGAAALTADDTDNPGSVVALLGSSDIQNLTVYPIDFAAADMSSVTVFGSGNGNVFYVVDSPAGILSTINSGSGSDFVQVLGSTGPVAIEGSGGLDTVVISDGGLTAAVTGTVSVANTGGSTDLYIDDSAEVASRSFTLNPGSVVGLTPSTVTWVAADIGFLSLNGGGGGNTIIVAGTDGGFTTELHTGIGLDTVAIRSTDAAGVLLVNGDDDDDVFTLGSVGLSTAGLQGPITIDNTMGTVAITINDTNGTTARTSTITETGIAAGAASLVPGGLNYSQVVLLTVNGGTVADNFSLDWATPATPRDTPITINGGGGPDTLNLIRSDGTGTGNTILNGQADSDIYSVSFNAIGTTAEVRIQDSGATGTDVANLTGQVGNADDFVVNGPSNPSYVVDLGQKMKFSGVEQMTLDGLDDSDTYEVYLGGLGTGGLELTLVTITDSGGGTDTANVFGTSGADTFNVNTQPSGLVPSFVQAVGFYTGLSTSAEVQVNYTATLEHLIVNGPAEADPVPTAPTQPDAGDTFYAEADPFTAITINGGNPTAGSGDTLVLSVVGVINPVVSVPARPNGSMTSTSHATIDWTSIETLPVPLGLGGTFDFQPTRNPVTTQPGFLAVIPTDTPTSGPYAFAGVGWLNSGKGAFDRVATYGAAGDPGGGLSLLLRDGQWGDYGGGSKNGVFQVAVAPNEIVQVTAILGDIYEARDQMNVYVGTVGDPLGTKLNPAITTFNSTGPSHRYVSYSGMFNPGSDDKLVITIETAYGGFSNYWTISALDVRPLGFITPLSITRVGGDGTVLADGLTIDQYTGSGADPFAVLTVLPDYGTPVNGSNTSGSIVSTDADSMVKGFQIRADVNGDFAFGILRPTGLGPSLITVTDVTGASGSGRIGPTSAGPVAVSPNPYLLMSTYTQTFALPTVRRIDFGSSSSPVATTSDPLDPYQYLGWSNTAYVSTVANALGWIGATPSLLDRGAGFNALQRDAVFNYHPTTGNFELDMPSPNTPYSVTVLLGDMTAAWNGMFVEIIDPASGTPISTPFSGVNTPAGQARSLTFTATSDALGRVRVRFGIASAPPANPFWTVEAIEIRPVFGSASPGAVAPVTVNGSTYSGSPTVLAGTVSADGSTITNYTISNATPNSLLTVAVSIGTVASSDLGPTYVGIQVLANASGDAAFSIVSPYATAATTSTITISEVTGAKIGVFVQNYVGSPVAPPVVQRFDFNSGTSPTQAGFTSVLNNTLYNATLGYGWKAAVSGYDRGSGGNPVNLYRDGAWGPNGSATFQVSVGAGQSRDVRVYVGDPYSAWTGITVSVEGNPTPVVVDSKVSRFGYVTLTGTDNGDGIFTITVTQANNSTWVVAGLDIATPGALPAPATPAATTLPGAGYRFDFNGPANNTTAAVGFVGVRGNTTYTPATGYGWLAAVSEFERAPTTMPGTMTADQKALYRDGAWGSGSASFLVAVPAGSGATARIYVGDSYTNWPNIQLRIEGNPTAVVATTTITPFAGYVLSGSDANGDGIITITVSGGPTWVLNGLDIVPNPPGSLPGLPIKAAISATADADDVAVLTDRELAVIASEAIRRWEATGISPEMSAILRGLTFRIGNPGGNDYLGSFAPGVVTIAPTAGSRGWFVDPTPHDDIEYDIRFASTHLHADRGVALGRYDLLTVVMHEMGHALGYDDLNANTVSHDLMAENLQPGSRRLPMSIITVSAAPRVDVAIPTPRISAPPQLWLAVEPTTVMVARPHSDSTKADSVLPPSVNLAPAEGPLPTPIRFITDENTRPTLSLESTVEWLQLSGIVVD